MTDFDFSEIPGIGATATQALESAGFNSLEEISGATTEELSRLPSIGEDRAEYLIHYSDK